MTKTKLCFQSTPTITGEITHNNESSYLEQINNLANWYADKKLLLNVKKKNKELIGDFRTKEVKKHTSVYRFLESREVLLNHVVVLKSLALMTYTKKNVKSMTL